MTSYNAAVRISILLMFCLALPLLAQETPAPAAPAQGQPPVKVNIINVCTPGAEEQKEIAAALSHVPQKPAFAVDFEVDRGRTQIPDGPLSSWVRMRRDFVPASSLSTVQYSFIVDDKGMSETLVFRARDPKDFLQIAIDNQVTGATDPTQVLATDTPVSHVKIERFGKSSLALARCEGDQSAYEPLFRSASALMSRYRTVLAVRRTVPADLRMLGLMKQETAPAKKPAPKAAKPAH